jgi:tRNA (cmo5U34)-methyltransferase
MDISEKMLGVARKRFEGREKIRFIAADYRDRDLGGPFDIIASALSIHHLEREEKRELYRRIFASLHGGGIFVNADEVAGETEKEHLENLASWDRFLMGGPLGADGARAIMDRRDRFDRMEKLSVQLEWMQAAGFTGVDAPYRKGTFVVFTGRKGQG